MEGLGVPERMQRCDRDPEVTRSEPSSVEVNGREVVVRGREAEGGKGDYWRRFRSNSGVRRCSCPRKRVLNQRLEGILEMTSEEMEQGDEDRKVSSCRQKVVRNRSDCNTQRLVTIDRGWEPR